MLVLAILLALVALVLVADAARVWVSDRGAVGTPERIQLLTGVAIAVFVGSFVLARAGDDGESAASATAPEVVEDIDPSSFSGLTAAARLPGLRPSAERERAREAPRSGDRKPAQTSPPAEQAAADEPPTTTTPAAPTLSPSTTPPPPAAEPPPPADEPLEFGSSG